MALDGMYSSGGISRRFFFARIAVGVVVAWPGGREGAHASLQRGGLQAARDLVKEGRLGRLRHAHVHLQRSGRLYRTVELTLRPTLDLMGVGRPDRVSAAGGPVREGLFPEHFMFTAYYSDGLRLVVTTAGRGGPGVTVRGTSGSMFVFPNEVQVALGDEAPRRLSRKSAETGWPSSLDNQDGRVQARILTAMAYASLRDVRVV